MFAKTAAYTSFRWGLALRAALEQGHFEHAAAEEYLDWLCMRSGYRTKHLPSDGEKYRQLWDDIFNAANVPDATPSGQDVINSIHAEQIANMLRKQGENTVDRVDDFRGPAVPKADDLLHNASQVRQAAGI